MVCLVAMHEVDSSQSRREWLDELKTTENNRLKSPGESFDRYNPSRRRSSSQRENHSIQLFPKIS